MRLELLEPRLMLDAVVASYRADFRADAPLAPGWQYLWNAPTGWDPATNSTGDMATGSIDDPSSFRPMLDAGADWTADGDTDGANHTPDSYVRLNSTGGHPGAPIGAVTGGTNGLARYAIAAYTLSADGYYAITHSYLTKPSTSGDAVEVRVSVNGGSPHTNLLTSPGATLQFDTFLGQLHAGDTVYVAFGPNTNHSSDTFRTDFAIEQTTAGPDPLRSLAVAQHFNVADYGATPDDSTNDAPAIQAAMDAANTWQQQNHQPVEVDFLPGQYRLYAGYVPGSPSVVLTLQNSRDMVIAGNGAELLVTDPTVGAFNLNTCSNMILRDFTIDYETLPFTQGFVAQIIDAHSFVLDIQAGFPAPSDSQFVNTTQRWGYPIDPVVDGRIRADANNVYFTTDATPLSGQLYQMTISTGTSTLQVGDRYVEQARTGSGLLYVRNSTQVSAIGVTAYAGPSAFLIGYLADAVNVIDCHVEIKPGRWKSLDADGVHIQSARIGAWVENSSFEGLSDDVMNFYTVPFAVTQVLSDTQFKVGALLNEGTVVSSFGFRHLRVGDHLTFLDPNAGTPLANVRVTAVDLTAQTINVDQAVTGITTGTTKLVTNIYNNDLTGSFVVQGTSFLNSRRFGLTIKASNGQVLDNHFEGLSNEAINIYNEPDRPVGLWGGHILIQGNTFVDNGFEYQYKHQTRRIPGAIGIYAEKLGYLSVDGLYVHPNIQIVDNTFEGWRRAAIAAGNVENLEIRGNHFLASTDDPAIAQDTVLVLTSADGATITDNSCVELTTPDVFLSQDSYCFDVTESGTWIDHPPTVIGVTPSSIEENRPIGTVVGDLWSTDPDSGDSFIYSLADSGNYPDNAWFTVEGGQIKTAARLDHEARASYSICVRSTDSGKLWVEQPLAITVTDVNEAPLLDATGAIALAAIEEDDRANGGTTVLAILASAGGAPITDPDAGALEGIAVVAVDNSHGVWQFKAGPGGEWTDFNAPSNSQARLLAADTNTSIRFLPAANWEGTVGSGIAFRAWDQTSGANGGIEDASLNGDPTAFSTATETAAITVNSVNDLPTISDVGDRSTNEDASIGPVDFTVGDVETSVSHLTVTGRSSNTAMVPDANIALAGDGANRTLTITPLANRFGTATITLSVTDGDGGTAEGVFVLTVISVNDVPLVTALADSPDPATAGEGLTLTASGAADPLDPTGFVASVAFYRESNGQPGLQTEGDALVGTDTDSADGWSVSVSNDALVGTDTYYAQATDNEGGKSSEGLAASATTNTTHASCNLDVDGNGTADALTDGILILRYLFDSAGPWNYTDALGSGAARTTRATIKAFLDGGRTDVLDVDGNGAPDALTDGILILRYLFDSAGPWNYTDALGGGATRTTRSAIKSHLDQYSPAVPSPQAPLPQTGEGTQSTPAPALLADAVLRQWNAPDAFDARIRAVAAWVNASTANDDDPLPGRRGFRL